MRKRDHLLLGLMAAALSMPYETSGRTTRDEINSGNNDYTRKKYLDNLKRRGVHEFNIDGKIIIARDYENALRKFKRLTPSV